LKPTLCKQGKALCPYSTQGWGGCFAIVLNSESESVSVIDASSGEVVATIPLATAWQVYLPAVLK
jgi:YVTN family beta-propeller protein